MMESTDGNIGRLLKERREELGYTLQEAEEETRIRKTFLESLENNHFSELPGQAYVTGFIRVYASYLGLKSKPLLVLLSELQNSATLPPEIVKPNLPRTVLRTDPSSGGDWRKFFLAFILVLVLGGGFYFLPAMFPGDEQADESATKVTETESEQVASRKSQPEIETSQAEPEKTQTQAVDQGKPRESENVVSSQASAQTGIIAKQQVLDSMILPVIPDNGASLRMLALADSSLIIKVDARKPQQYDLHDGLDLTWKIKERVSVEFAAGDVARFWLDGQEIDIAGFKNFKLQPAGE